MTRTSVGRSLKSGSVCAPSPTFSVPASRSILIRGVLGSLTPPSPHFLREYTLVSEASQQSCRSRQCFPSQCENFLFSQALEISSVFCEKEAFKRRLKRMRAAGSSRRGRAWAANRGLSPAAAPLWNSLFRGAWLKPVEIKKTFQFYLSPGWARVTIQRAQEAPAKRKTHKTYFN